MYKQTLGIACFALATLAVALPLQAEDSYENAPAFRSSDFLPASVLNSPDYTISKTVPTVGLMGVFKLHTDYGDFECRGVEMLHIRLDELRALDQIDQISRTKVFTDAAKGAVLKPVDAAVEIVSDPVGSVAAIPKGVERLFGRVVKGTAAVGKGIANEAKNLDSKYDEYGERKPEEKRSKGPAPRQDPFGYNTTRNAWAQHFGVDPYTSNTVLAGKLDALARISFGADTLTGLGIGMVSRSVNMVSSVDKFVLTETPAAVRDINAERLSNLGVQKQTMKALLDNRWFTPTLQSRFVKGLASMQGVSDASSIVRLAQDIQSEEEARFLCRGVELLAFHHKKAGPLNSFHPLGRIPAAYAQNGSLIVSGPVDVIAWTKVIAEYAPQWDRPSVHPVLCTSGQITKQARRGFADCGWSVHLIDIATASTTSSVQ